MGHDVLPESWDKKILYGIVAATVMIFMTLAILRDRTENQFITEVHRTLKATSPQSIQKITIRLWVCCGKDNPIDLSPSKFPEFSNLLKTLEPTGPLGWRGQRWHHFREVEVATETGTYRILFSTRRTLSQPRVLARIKLPVIGDDSQYFEATQLWYWLSVQPEVVAQGPISLPPAEK